MSTGLWILIIAASILITWLLTQKSLLVNGWRLLYTFLAVCAFIALLDFGKECARSSFQPKTAELKIIQAQGEVQKGEIAGMESYKATYELFNSQFSQLLVILGFFGTLFGIVLPVGAYLLQRQSLKDERERMKAEWEEHKKQIERNVNNMRKEMENVRAEIANTIEENSNCHNSHNMSLARILLGMAHQCEKDIVQKIVYYIMAFMCYVNAKEENVGSIATLKKIIILCKNKFTIRAGEQNLIEGYWPLSENDRIRENAELMALINKVKKKLKSHYE